MKQTKFLKGECQHCHGHIEFPAESVGLTTDCPHCGKQTELLLAIPKEEPTIPRATIVYTVIAVLILGAGLAGAIVALKMAQHNVTRNKAEAVSEAPAPTTTSPVVTEDPMVQAGFRVSAVTIEKTPGTSLRHAIGTLTNASNRQRFGVRIQFDLFDDSGQKLDTTKDYQQVIEPEGEWKFSAPVMASKATAAKVTSVTEEK